MNLKDTCAIVGIGETKFGTLPGISCSKIAIEATKKAIEDAGLQAKDIDGLLSPQPASEMFYGVRLGEKMGLKLKYTGSVDIGGATPVAMVQHAVMAINAGLCNTVVCMYAGSPKSGPKHASASCPQIVNNEDEFMYPFGQVAAMHGYAMACLRLMFEFRTTSKQLGAIAVACRKHASLTENAQRRDPITLTDYMNSKLYCDPFRLLDICQVTDGGAAVVVTNVERADVLRNKPVYISGMGNRHQGWGIGWAPSMTTTGAKDSSEMAYKMAGMKAKDVDIAEIYDCFTYTVLVTLEDYGFCEKGEGGPFIENGRIEIGGELPVNTSGGLLSQGHLEGMNHITEAVKQLRGVCGQRQVNGAEIAIVSGNGGILSTHSTLILRR